MAVYYRYRSGVDTFSVPVPAPSISVGELKRLIMGTSRHGHGQTRGRGPREGIALSNAQTGEEYTEESSLVPRNSTVVVRRVAGPPAETIVAASPRLPKATQDGSSTDSAASPGASTGAADDEDKAISAVIDTAQLKWEDPSQGASLYGRRSGGAHDGRVPPARYVCHRCRVPGHFIQHCPTNDDPRFDNGRATAAPLLAQAPAIPDDGIPVELYCKICKKVMADAVLTSKCCFNSFCDRCIRGHIVANSKCACAAHARADDLIPNPTLRTAIANMLATRTSSASGGAGKPRSSVGSNTVAEAEPASHSPAASQESRRPHVTPEKPAASEHSPGSGSTSKNATTPAEHEPRKKRETVDTTGAHVANHADHFGYGVPFGPACYDPFFGGMPWAADPCTYYGGVPYGGGYPIGPHHVGAMGDMPVPPPRRYTGSYGYHGGKRTRASSQRDGSQASRWTDCEGQRHEEQSQKRRCVAF